MLRKILHVGYVLSGITGLESIIMYSNYFCTQLLSSLFINKTHLFVNDILLNVNLLRNNSKRIHIISL
jgi:hypothetical protein